MSFIGDLRTVRQLRREVADAELRASLNNPAVALSSDAIIAVLGSGLRTDSGINVSELTAMRFSAVWRCVSLLAGIVAQLPLESFGMTASGSKSLVSMPLLDSPYPGMTPYMMWELVMVHLLLWGNAFLLKIRDEGGRVVRLLPLNPWGVYVRREVPLPGAAFGHKIFTVSGAEQTYDDYDILHIPGVGYDGIQGLSPIAHARQGIGLGVAAEEFGARFFGSGANIGGVLQSDKPITQEHADTVKARWRDKMSGLSRAHEIAVLDNGLHYTAVGIPPDDAQFLQTRQFQVVEICRLYGVPPHLAMEVDTSTSWGTGIAEQTMGFVKYTVSMWTTRIEQALTMHLCANEGMPTQYVEFDFDRLLRGDAASRFAVHSTAIANKIYTPFEARVMENMPPNSAVPNDFPAAVAPPPPIVPPVLKDKGTDPKGA